MDLDPALPPDDDLLDYLRDLEIGSSAKAFKGEACERYTKSLRRAQAAVAAHVLGPAYEQLRELVARFGARYEQLKADRAALDFEDLQLKAVELLTDSDALRGRYREQFDHLMVDEFQDTNGLQLRLIEQLRGPDTRLFLVGDEFQSIYGFRHADVEVYRRQHRRFEEGKEANGEALPLTGNFRAAPELVATTNAIGRSLLEGFEPLTAFVEEEPGGGSAVELLLTVDDKKGWEAEETALPRLADDPSSGSKVAEARRLAGRLRRLVDDENVDPAEIVVLMRAFTHVAAVETALKDAGLDPYVVGGRGFWSQQQIDDLRCLLAVIANPLDDAALFGALASPACAVLPDTLWLLRRAATWRDEERDRERHGHIWPLVRDLVEKGEPSRGDAEAAALIPPEELERLRRFAAILTELRQRSTEGGLETLIERTASDFDYDVSTLSRVDGNARWANVRKLMRLAREFEASEGPDLGGFLEYLDSRAASRDREAEAATRAEGHAGVRVMTVHGAKGLEFEIVAVADLGRNLQLGWSSLRVQPGEEGPEGEELARVGVQLGRLGRPAARLHDYQELADLAAERDAEEEARLAYVAATRAKRRLILSGTFSRNALKKEITRRKPIALQLIRSLLDGEATDREIEISAADDGYPTGRLRVSVSEPGPGAGAELLAPREAEPTEETAGDADPPLGRPEVPPALIGGLSYSALSAFENCGYRFYVERVLGIGEPEVVAVDGDGQAGPEVRRRFGPGLAVHSLLEWSARNRWREPSDERVDAALREQGLEDVEGRAQVLALTKAFLDSPFREEIADARVSPEVPFVLSIGGTLIRGSIDLLAVRPDGSVLVVDYKTDRLAAPGPGGDRHPVLDPARPLRPGRRRPRRPGGDRLRLPGAAGRTRAHELRSGGARGGTGSGGVSPGEARGRPLRGHRPPAPGALRRLPGAGAALQLRPAAQMRDDPIRRSSRARDDAAPPAAAQPAEGMSRLGLFGYGSLVLTESASMTLGRPAGELRPARLHDWRRRFSQRRDNLTCEKTFECDGGWRPEWILGLNVEEGEDEAGPVNGVVIELTEAELDRLDIREIRYDRVEVTGSMEGEGLPERIVTYKAKPFHFAPEPPEDAVILRTYAEAVEMGFEALGPGELEHYRATTPYPVDRVDAELVLDRIPEGNPRDW